MGQKLVIGPFNRGLRTDRPAFMIDNDSFPTLTNAYQWRGRVKRKRGTSLLGRLQYFFETGSIGNSGASVWNFNLFTVAGFTAGISTIDPGTVEIFINPTNITGNLIPSPVTSPPNLAYTNASDCGVFTNTIAGLKTGDRVTIAGVNVVPNSGPNLINDTWNHIEVITLDTSFKLGVNSKNWGQWASGGTWTKVVGSFTFIDDGNGNLVSTTPGNSGTINYLTGDISLTHTAGPGVPTSAVFAFYPNLPVMGLEDFEDNSSEFPGTIGFDTQFAYNITPTFPYTIYNVNFYKNPAASALLPGYVPKTTQTSFHWNGLDYQQFWTTNYQGSMWAVNGIKVPFPVVSGVSQNLAMQFAKSTDIAYVANTATTITVTIAGSPLVVGDFVFFNEWTTAGNSAFDLNFQTGYVTTGGPNFVITLPFANLGAGPFVPGIIQYLTNSSDPTKDCIRWYDGDPTFNAGSLGWVNFAPPLSQFAFSVAELPADKYYLIGARIVLPFKDRLIFIGPVVQTSADGSQKYLQDTVIYSQNGTPYYTASFIGNNRALTSADTVYHPILVPVNQTATANAWIEDSAGYGGFASAGLDQPIGPVSSDQDVLIMGFSTAFARFVYTGNDVNPFVFYLVNSELGGGSVFSAINTDSGMLSRGTRGFTLTSQTNSQRFDLEIPDRNFQINLASNGSERLTAIRDFENEWIYFTYPVNNIGTIFPNQTLFYNYRDHSFALFDETYTHYGTFRKASGQTWLTLTTPWNAWNEPWNAGETTLYAPQIIAGNQQGFVMIREDESTKEGPSLAILNIVPNIITSPNHGLNDGDYIFITNVDGTIATEVNNKIFRVTLIANDPNNFRINPTINAGTYTGGGLITRLSVPFIQTKQFPVAWADARKTRIGVQQYLLTKTDNAQITLLMYLSQNSTNAWNASPVIPANNVVNDSLIYDSILYTCPESTNLGLTPANTNLQQLTTIDSFGTSSNVQAQIWHRVNTSLIGDTVQLGFTLSDAQMTTVTESGAFISQDKEIEINGIILDLNPSGMLA